MIKRCKDALLSPWRRTERVGPWKRTSRGREGSLEVSVIEVSLGTLRQKVTTKQLVAV